MSKVLQLPCWCGKPSKVNGLCKLHHLYAARGYDQAWVYAFCMTFGKHPSKAIPIWQERRDRWASMGLAEMENHANTDRQRSSDAANREPSSDNEIPLDNAGNRRQFSAVERVSSYTSIAGREDIQHQVSSSQDGQSRDSQRGTSVEGRVANLYLTAAQEIEKPSPVSVPRKKAA